MREKGWGKEEKGIGIFSGPMEPAKTCSKTLLARFEIAMRL